MSFLNADGWRAATWSAPFVVQLILGLLLTTMWLLGKWPFGTHSADAGERLRMLTAAVITTLLSLALAAALLRSRAARLHGLALSVAGSSAVVLIGGVVYAYLVLR